MVFKRCIEHDSDAVVLCAKCKFGMGEGDFMRFKFNMRFALAHFPRRLMRIEKKNEIPVGHTRRTGPPDWDWYRSGGRRREQRRTLYQVPGIPYRSYTIWIKIQADLRFAPSQWETVLRCNDVSHWLGTSLESALRYREATIIDAFWWNSETLVYRKDNYKQFTPLFGNFQFDDDDFCNKRQFKVI